jgi:hypothetical protein
MSPNTNKPSQKLHQYCVGDGVALTLSGSWGMLRRSTLETRPGALWTRAINRQLSSEIFDVHITFLGRYKS